MPVENKPAVARYLLPVLLFLFVAVLVRDIYGFSWDTDAFRAWAVHDFESGLGQAYYSGTDYLPLYHYILYGYAWLLGDSQTVINWFPCVHLVTFLFDMLGIWIIYKWIDKRYDYNTLLLLLVLNIGYTYNTLIWGQVDGILTTLVFASIYLAWQGKMTTGAILFVLAINMKLQAIVFLPVFGLLYLFQLAAQRRWRAGIWPPVAAMITQVVILLPFIMEKEGLPLLWKTVSGSVGKWPNISMNAFNFWYLLYENPRYMPDDQLLINGWTHKQVGLVLFFTTSFIALLPLLTIVWRKLRNSMTAVHVDRRQLWLVCALVNLLFFYFNTQMHERYCHPALIFVAAYAYYSRDFFPFVLFSVIYLLNMDAILQWLQLNRYNGKLLIYNPVLLSSLYLVVICYLAVRLIIISRLAAVAGRLPVKENTGRRMNYGLPEYS